MAVLLLQCIALYPEAPDCHVFQLCQKVREPLITLKALSHNHAWSVQTLSLVQTEVGFDACAQPVAILPTEKASDEILCWVRKAQNHSTLIFFSLSLQGAALLF